MNNHSGFLLSQADRRPMYLQIMEQVRGKVASGDWKPGDEIPSIRGLAVELNVSVITVKRAYLELEREGVIVTRQGKGSRIADDMTLKQQLRDDEINQHLEAAAKLAGLTGVQQKELLSRLRRIDDQLRKRGNP